MKTEKLVKKMRNESKEVKSSVGGRVEYRRIMDTVLDNIYEVDENTFESRMRSDREIADIVETKHTTKDIDVCKNIYQLEAQGR